ncbi:hypothetical protein TRIUR3_32531 [Triticum urartu]|uniref:Uncharacterized protein n=1 Tax=Triticum urartu TaxID=4572 RepID=M7YQJ7_TRIUA|nr:hypothetical protein TRIUR3_32531 [Triticum urartu]
MVASTAGLVRRDWNIDSDGSDHRMTELNLQGSLAAQIAFEGNSCFRCVKLVFEATKWEGDGDTPLHYAARSGNLRMLFHLVCQLGEEYGHKGVELLLRKLNVHGETALHEAISPTCAAASTNRSWSSKVRRHLGSMVRTT